MEPLEFTLVEVEDQTMRFRVAAAFAALLVFDAVLPAGIVYTLNNRRAENQAGVFTIHDDSGEALNLQQKEDVITSFAIEKDEIDGANLFLKLSRVNPYTIYPDFGGLAGYIRAMLTGEPLPVDKSTGDTVVGGSVNKTGVFRFRATRVGTHTTLPSRRAGGGAFGPGMGGCSGTRVQVAPGTDARR